MYLSRGITRFSPFSKEKSALTGCPPLAALAAPLHLMACDVPVVSPPVPVVHVSDATVAAHGEPVSVAEAAEWTGITVDAF